MDSSSTAGRAGRGRCSKLRRVCTSRLEASCICQLFLLIVFDYIVPSMGGKGVLGGEQRLLAVGIE